MVELPHHGICYPFTFIIHGFRYKDGILENKLMLYTDTWVPLCSYLTRSLRPGMYIASEVMV